MAADPPRRPALTPRVVEGVVPSHPRDAAAAGASARAKADAIRRARERRSTDRSGGAHVLRALLGGPSATERRSIEAERRWARGATGERMLARDIARRCPAVPLLNDLRVPGTRANIDHIAVAPSGVFVIDAKRYKGRITVAGGWFRSERLLIAGRDRTKLIDGLEWQIEKVRRTLQKAGLAEVPVHGCLCFVQPEGLLADVELPLLRTLRVRGLPLYYSRRLCRVLARPGPLTSERAEEIAQLLGDRFPAARR